MVVSPDSRYAYVSGYQYDPATQIYRGTVTVINPATGGVASIQSTGYAVPSVAVSPDGRYAYVSGYQYDDATQNYLGTVTILNPATGATTTIQGVDYWERSSHQRRRAPGRRIRRERPRRECPRRKGLRGARRV